MLTDIAPLLAPIAPDSPCGPDLSFSEEFDRLQELRREEDASLEAGDWVRELKHADWPEVAAQASELLAHRTKDLRVAAWLAEALGKTDGFAGLAQGFDLVRTLLENHWEGLHPQAAAGDLDERAGNLGWLFKRSAALVGEIPLTRSDRGEFCWNDFESARALQLQMERDSDHAETLAEGRITNAQLRDAKSRTPRSFYEALQRDFPRLGEAARSLEKLIDERFGDAGPPTSDLRNALAAVEAVIDKLLRESGVASIAAPAPSDSPAAPGEEAAAARFGGAIRSRAEALRQLRLVADYFRQTEPHSPVTYLAEKAARWGELPLHSWLRQVIRDPGTLGHLEELLGLENPEGGNA